MISTKKLLKSLFVLIPVTTLCLYTFYIFSRGTSFRYLSKNTSNVVGLYTYGDLETHLCLEHIDWTKRTPMAYTKVLECPDEKIVSVSHNNGRTGNLMWAYASIIAVANQTGLRPYIPKCIKSGLEDFFDNLTLPTFEHISHCPIKFLTFVFTTDEWKKNPEQSIILPHYVARKAEIMPWIPNIRQKFTIKKKFKNLAQDILRNSLKNVPSETYTFVGVHVRRTDYEKYLKYRYHVSLAPPHYFLKAMSYFRKKYPNIIFIIVSDDPKWCFAQFGKLREVYVVPASQDQKTNPIQDLAILEACNHTIYDYGTFGEWGALLAGGEVVVYDMIQNSNVGSLSSYQKTWRLLS